MNRAASARRPFGLVSLMTTAWLAACATSSAPPGGGGANFDSGNVDATFGEDGGSDGTAGVEASIEASAGDSVAADTSVAEAAADSSTVDSQVVDSQAIDSCLDAGVVDSSMPLDAPADVTTPPPDSGPDSSSQEAGEAGTTGFGAATSVSLGYCSACALTVSGGVVCWGENKSGVLGDNSALTSAVPVQVTGLTSGMTAVSVGYETACALTSAGAVVCWGDGGYGELGNGQDVANSPVPVQVTGLTGGVTAISAGQGSYSTCAVTAGGGVVCWGYNLYGQLGNNSKTLSDVPVQVSGLTSGVTAVSVGTSSACAVTAGGGVMCWGDNSQGQLGNNSMTASLVPVQVSGLTSGVSAVAVGQYSACALTTGGSVMCWGWNIFGQLGNATTTSSNVPVQVTGLTSGVAEISVGQFTACARTSGAVSCWGYGMDGELGNNAASSSNVPVPVSNLAGPVPSVSAAVETNCAVVNCNVQCWGSNQYDQFGNTLSGNSLVPTTAQLLGGPPCP